ncbi:MAG: hypothetical protein IPL06_02325 [Betaproteobacteria bacterium]|nr:hypothetical protein [Betaproteobacteria bacterium]
MPITAIVRCLLVALAMGFVASARGEPPAVGAPLPSLELKDQHDKPWRVAPEARLLLFASGRQGSNLVLEVLADQPEGFLASRQAAYLADMSRMPGFVTEAFALPALRAQPFAVGVVLDAKVLADWPRDDAAVQLIGIDGGKVTSLGRAANAPELRAALGL